MTEIRWTVDSASDLMAVNDALVLAASRAQRQADDATRARHEAERLGGLDALTQLPGRAQTLEALAHAVAQARRGSTRLAVLFLDLDHFKRINDLHGHAAGDQVLRESADRLRQALREADFVGRYGGDEFIVLLTDVAHPAGSAPIADKLIAAVKSPQRVADRVLCITPSIGIALFPEDATTGDALLAQADSAMYRAKSRGAGNFAFSHDLRQAAPASSLAPGTDVPSAASSTQDFLDTPSPHGMRQKTCPRDRLGREAVARNGSDPRPESRLVLVARPSPRTSMRRGQRRIPVEIPATCAVCRGHDLRMAREVRRLCKITTRFTPRLEHVVWAVLLSEAMARPHDGEAMGRRMKSDRTPFLAPTGSQGAR